MQAYFRMCILVRKGCILVTRMWADFKTKTKVSGRFRGEPNEAEMMPKIHPSHILVSGFERVVSMAREGSMSRSVTS